EEKIYDSGHGQTRRRRARPRIGVGFFVFGYDVASTRRRVALRTGGGPSARRADDGAEVQKHSGLERIARIANAPDDELHKRLARRELRVLPRQERRPVGVRERRQQPQEDRAPDDPDDDGHQQEFLPGQNASELLHLPPRERAYRGRP